jgi:hypothetical protein
MISLPYQQFAGKVFLGLISSFLRNQESGFSSLLEPRLRESAGEFRIPIDQHKDEDD